MKDLRITCPDDVTFHKKRANRSVTPRRRDFNYLYSKFTKEKFGGHQEGMFVKLAEKLSRSSSELPSVCW